MGHIIPAWLVFLVVAGICLWNLVRAWRKGEIGTRYGSTVSRTKSPRMFVFLVVSNSVGLAAMVAGLIDCAITGNWSR